ncbi:DNRLRE domain-containing protein [Inediibacterium massiliense]|uniref:DNRLRE domain-containing protein n=1 Tax=Inediibacterium massiliense TaxID=1658111 RepID=UPI0006B536AB|nr:DNRLRE domain-containing protein [Inediibacterium massiliense]
MNTIKLFPTQNVYISQYYPSINYAQAPSLDVGRFTGPGDTKRTLLQFDFSSLVGNIESAYLNLYLYRNEVPSISKPNTIYQLETSFDQNTVTYNTAPSYSSTANASVSITNEINKFIQWDITSLVKGWMEKTITNNGIILIGLESANGLVAYKSTRWADSAYWPYLEIHFSGNYLFTYPVENVTTTNDQSGSTPIFLGPRIATFGIKNTGNYRGDVLIQLSPDGSTWIDHLPLAYTVPSLSSQDTITLSTSAYFNYARIAYASHTLGEPTTLSIYASIKG